METPPRSTVHAMDRVQDRPDRHYPGRSTAVPLSRWLRWLAGLALIVAGIWGAFAWIQRDASPPESDLLFRMATTAADFQRGVQLRDGDEASAWVFDQYGWPIVIPDLPGLQLVGAGETALAETGAGAGSDWVMPTFEYVGTGAERVVLYAYDYAQLDRALDWLRLPQGVYSRLAEETPFDTRRIEPLGAYALTWRRRAVVYTAVTAQETVVERLTETLSTPARL